MPIFFREPGWNPPGELAQLQRRMDRLFQNAYDREGRPERVGVYPAMNISEDRDHIFIRAELPGVRAADLSITLQDNSLILRGERKIAAEDKEVNYHRRERESGFLRRIVALPLGLQGDTAAASCKDGILTIKLAKPEAIKPRKIEVKVG